MSSNRLIAILIAVLIFGVSESSAQIGGFLKDKAQKSVVKGLKRGEEEKKVEQQQEEQKVEQKEQTQHQAQPNPAGNFMQKKMMGMMGMNNVKYDLAYNYTSSLKMDIETVDSASTEVNKGTYTSYFDKNSKNFAMEFEGIDKESGQKQKSLMIFDYKNMSMLILTEKDGQKSGIAMVIPPDSSSQANAESEKPTEVETTEDLSAYNMYYKPTGRSKSVAGFSCKEFAYENPEGRVELWATNDVKYDYTNAYGQMNGFQALATAGFGGYLLGTVMEMHFKDSNSSARSDLFVKEINPTTNKTFSIADYQIIGFGGDSAKGK